MINLLFTENTALDMFLNPQESYCYVIVLLSIFALFYLVFCCFYRVNNIVKLIGGFWIGCMVCGDIIILAKSTDIYSSLATIFSILLVLSILSVILPPGKEVEGDNIEYKGSYVISQTPDDKLIFELYDAHDKLLLTSNKTYSDFNSCKKDVGIARESGKNADFTDFTNKWIKQVDHPRFEIYSEDNKFFYRLCIDDSFVIMTSAAFNSIKECRNSFNKVKKAIGTQDLYMSSNVSNVPTAQKNKTAKPKEDVNENEPS